MNKEKHIYDITNLRMCELKRIEYVHRNLFIYSDGKRVYLVEEVELE